MLYRMAVRRFALIFMLAFLTYDLSGLDSFLITERCASMNDTLPDNTCPPTCVRCNCCAQPIVSIPTTIVVHLTEPQSLAEPVMVQVAPVPPHDILHIPRSFSLIA